MKKYRSYFLILGFLFMLLNTPVFACKMTAMGGSTQVIKAILDQIAADDQQQSRDIKAIKQEKPSAWVYKVETTDGDNQSQTTVYQVTIEPDCKIDVHQLPQQ